jgi:hypothetical protein
MLVVPSIETMAFPLPYATDHQNALTGKILRCQSNPSTDVAAYVELVETAINTPPPKVMSLQELEAGITDLVQVMPSGDMAAILLFVANATNTPLP